MIEHVTPPPAYQRRLPSRSVTIAYIGLQAETAVDLAEPLGLLSQTLHGDDSPPVAEWARFTDGAAFENKVLIAYWPDRADFDRWSSNMPCRLLAFAQDGGAIGLWMEVVTVPTDRYENIFSTPTFAVGSGRLMPTDGVPTDMHGYWGSMRERLAVSERDALVGAEADLMPPADLMRTRGRRISVQAPPNLALIRSGQDTSRCAVDERDEYDRLILPALREGMSFLGTHASETGCVSSRFMQEVDGGGRLTGRSFGHALFLSLADLERWSETHPTHLAIYNRFSAFARRRGPDLKLDLWHEVVVLEPEQARFEYANCHAGTGLLRLAT